MDRHDFLRPSPAHMPGVVSRLLWERIFLDAARVRPFVVGIPDGYGLPRPPPATGIDLSLLRPKAVCVRFEIAAWLLFAMQPLVGV
jgi:hypothetical protein